MKDMFRIARYGAMGFAVFVAMLLGLALNEALRPKPPTLPDADDVTRIVAQATDIRPWSAEYGTVKDFVIPKKYIPDILYLLTPAEFGPNYFIPEHEHRIVQLAIETKEGRTVKLDVYWSGFNRLFFTVDGVRCQRGGAWCGQFVSKTTGKTTSSTDEGMDFCQMIEEISLATSEDERDERFKAWLHVFKVARGHLPPHPAP